MSVIEISISMVIFSARLTLVFITRSLNFLLNNVQFSMTCLKSLFVANNFTAATFRGSMRCVYSNGTSCLKLVVSFPFILLLDQMRNAQSFEIFTFMRNYLQISSL